MTIYNPNGSQNISSVTLFGNRLLNTIATVNSNQQNNKTYSVAINVSSGANVVVPAIADKAISVESYTIVASGASTTYFASSGTRLTGDMLFGANGGVRTDSQSFYTAKNESLVLNCTSYIGGHLSYKII